MLGADVPGFYAVCPAGALEFLQVFPVAFLFDYEYAGREFSGHFCIVQGLAQAFGPFVGEVKFYGVVVCYAVYAGFVLQNYLCLAVEPAAPLLLIGFLRVQVFGLGDCRGDKHNRQYQAGYNDQLSAWFRSDGSICSAKISSVLK